MSIKLKIERIKKYKITDIDALKNKELPDEYLNEGYPVVTLTEHIKTLFIKYQSNNGSKIQHIHINDEFTESEFNDLKKIIKAAGNRLHKINHKHHIKEIEEKEDWSGTHTFEV